MNELFVNPELKKSSFILTIIFLSTILLFNISFNLYFFQFRKSYIQNNAAIVGSILSKHPELEKELVPLVTKSFTDKDKVKGIEVLKKYNYDENLDIEFIPKLKKDIKSLSFLLNIAIVIIFSILFVFNVIQYIRIYRKVHSIAKGAECVLKGNYDIKIYEDEEGEFSKLAYSFNDMKIVIKNNIDTLKREKTFLKDLLSDISHQLKTPLSSLIIFNELLLSKDLSEEEENKVLINIKNQLNRMEWLIKSLLKLGKLDSGTIIFNNKHLSLNDTIYDSIDIIKNKASEEEIDLMFEDNEEIIMDHDREWLSEAIINILKNAIEHTHKGGYIKISLDNTPLYYGINISDNGEGISKKDLPNIFKRFYKSSKKKESVGIGLALSKSIIEGQGGYIEVESEKEIGTTFHLIFLKYTMNAAH